MIRSNLRVDVHDPYILVALRGTCLRAKFRKQDAPWLAMDEYGPEDPEATITSIEFRTLAWAAANEEAQTLQLSLRRCAGGSPPGDRHARISWRK